jgi:hypothetical protein
MADLPTFHFLVPMPGLHSTWVIQAARRFWLRYRPILTDDWTLLSCVPQGASVTVTVLAQPETEALAHARCAALAPGAVTDVIVASDLPALEAALDARAQASQVSG